MGGVMVRITCYVPELEMSGGASFRGGAALLTLRHSGTRVIGRALAGMSNSFVLCET